MKQVGNTYVYEIEYCKCETPLDPYYACKPYAPFVPMQGPFCKRCGKFIEIDLPEVVINGCQEEEKVQN